MANHQSAKKRIRSNNRKKDFNRLYIKKLRAMMKKLYTLEDKAEAEKELKDTVKMLDKTVSKGRMHKNTAARRKSSIVRYVNGLGEKA